MYIAENSKIEKYKEKNKNSPQAHYREKTTVSIWVTGSPQ